MSKAGQFQRGNQLSTGPKGGVNKRFITQRLISMMHEEISVIEKEEKTAKNSKAKTTATVRRVARLQLFCETLFNLALSGDMQALKYIADRIEGTPTQTTVMVEEFDQTKMEAERKRLDEQRKNLANLTDDERTALYFQALKQIPGSSGQTPSH